MTSEFEAKQIASQVINEKVGNPAVPPEAIVEATKVIEILDFSHIDSQAKSGAMGASIATKTYNIRRMVNIFIDIYVRYSSSKSRNEILEIWVSKKKIITRLPNECKKRLPVYPCWIGQD